MDILRFAHLKFEAPIIDKCVYNFRGVEIAPSAPMAFFHELILNALRLKVWSMLQIKLLTQIHQEHQKANGRSYGLT